MIRRFILVGILLVLVLGGLIGFNYYRAGGTENAAAPPPTVVSATEALGMDWTPTIDTFGTVNAVRGVDVASEATGVVREVLFTANESVEEGQLLAQIDDAVDRAELSAAEAAVERDRLAFERAQALTERGAGTAAARDDAQSTLAASRSELERLRAVLDQKAIEAPFSGTIGIPRIDVGQYVTAGTVIATLQDLDRMRVDFTVAERSARDLEIGQGLRVGPDGDDLAFEGRITGIDPKSDAASRMVSVRGVIDNPGTSLRTGQFVEVQVLMPEEPGVVAVPQTAVVTSLYGDYVFVVAPMDGQAQEEGVDPALAIQQVFVTAGRTAGDLIEIVNGLEAGQRVVTVGQNRLFNGMPVAVEEASDQAQLAETQ